MLKQQLHEKFQQEIPHEKKSGNLTIPKISFQNYFNLNT